MHERQKWYKSKIKKSKEIKIMMIDKINLTLTFNLINLKTWSDVWEKVRVHSSREYLWRLFVNKVVFVEFLFKFFPPFLEIRKLRIFLKLRLFIDESCRFSNLPFGNVFRALNVNLNPRALRPLSSHSNQSFITILLIHGLKANLN